MRNMDINEYIDWLWKNIYIILVTFYILLVLKMYKKSIQQKFNAFLLSKLDKIKEHPPMVAHKRKFFESLSCVKSFNQELRNENALKVLEIGVGTGANLRYYPDNTRLVVVDPNPNFNTYYNTNRAKFPNIKSEEIIIAYGEDMKEVPSNSVDVVVVTLVMCSVEDPNKVLKEIRRVLVSGGKFYFWEHIKEFDSNFKLRGLLQEVLTYSGIFRFLFDGCCFNRDILDAIHATGFKNVEAERMHTLQNMSSFYSFITWLVVPHLVGIATK